ncbi:hypothetical protein KY330_04210 [Candidatus Woesearchaeota archaeon]|nr:hypothetical protein [Candidatus Woesearchaeota archaeon]
MSKKRQKRKKKKLEIQKKAEKLDLTRKKARERVERLQDSYEPFTSGEYNLVKPDPDNLPPLRSVELDTHHDYDISLEGADEVRDYFSTKRENIYTSVLSADESNLTVPVTKSIKKRPKPLKPVQEPDLEEKIWDFFFFVNEDKYREPRTARCLAAAFLFGIFVYYSFSAIYSKGNDKETKVERYTISSP